MVHLKFILMLIIPILSFSQDEIFYKKFLEKKSRKIELPEKLRVKSPFYEIDLNGDGRLENFSVEKKSGEDWVFLYDFERKLFFSYELSKLSVIGTHSGVYKVSKRQLSKNLNVLLIYYYEGYSKYFNFRGKARLYIMTIPKDLKNISISKGPIILEEHRKRENNYYQRKYKIDLEDINKDGLKEITIQHRNIKKIMHYTENKTWKFVTPL